MIVKLIMITCIVVGLWIFVTRTQFVQNALLSLINSIDIAKSAMEKLSFIQKIILFFKKILLFILLWTPIYFRAFVVTLVPAFVIQLWSLSNRISFARGLNVVVLTAAFFPFLVFKYFLGYQTPVFDFMKSRLYAAKLRENLNDSNFDALLGYDDKGNPFKDGAGGTTQTSKIKKATIAIRQTKVSVKTINGRRKAEIITRHSRETETDKLIEMNLSGLGKRLSAPSIRFQDSPILTIDDNGKGGYVFDSDVPFNAGDYLGDWRSIFINPFSRENRRINGGEGFIATTLAVIKEYVSYFFHLTPMAIFEQTQLKAIRKFLIDRSFEKARYKVQSNLNLSLIPDPVDPVTGNNIEEQKEIAIKAAQNRIEDIERALNSFKLSGAFSQVNVGGNTAVYEYSLPRTADLPTDFDKIQKGIGNMLEFEDDPIIVYKAGKLSVSVVNGVPIPIDFKEMIKNRPKGVSSIISGLIGVSALGESIIFELNDKIPHSILFGKTGTGKTVSLLDIVYSAMDTVDPDHLKIAYIDFKGNSFEFMRTDNSESNNYHPNPYTYAQPADGSGDIMYARALINHFVKETRRRIDLFKKEAVSKLEDYNKKYPNQFLPVILVVVDEFSAGIDRDKELKGEEALNLGITDMIEYLSKMSRSVGIHILLANQTARKEKVPGKITANISGRVSLGVSESIESEIALPETGISAHLISQQGEFYSLMKGANRPEHGFSPYLPNEVMYKLNEDLENKFGHREYFISREAVLIESGIDVEETEYAIPDPMPTVAISLEALKEVSLNYPKWAIENKNSPIFKNPDFMNDSLTPKERKIMRTEIDEMLVSCAKSAKTTRSQRSKMKTRPNSGTKLAEDITKGNDKGVI